MTKGEAIRFVKGKYVGLNGWMDGSKKMKKNSVYQHVIVVLDEDHKEQKATRVKKNSFRKEFSSPPRNYVEAAMMQHPDIEKDMIDLAEKFAQLYMRDNVDFLRIIDHELSHARAFQSRLGSKARYRHVVFDIAK